jgi:hypothetical protein
MNLCSRLVHHRKAIAPNLNRVVSSSTPKFLRIPPNVVAASLSLAACGC